MSTILHKEFNSLCGSAVRSFIYINFVAVKMSGRSNEAILGLFWDCPILRGRKKEINPFSLFSRNAALKPRDRANRMMPISLRVSTKELRLGEPLSEGESPQVKTCLRVQKNAHRRRGEDKKQERGK